jgi:hypothetical protein
MGIAVGRPAASVFQDFEQIVAMRLGWSASPRLRISREREREDRADVNTRIGVM